MNYHDKDLGQKSFCLKVNCPITQTHAHILDRFSTWTTKWSWSVKINTLNITSTEMLILTIFIHHMTVETTG